jgi:hypothetical protein
VEESSFLRIVLDVGETIVPKNEAYRDSRKLGVAVRWFELSPYPSTNGASEHHSTREL